MMVIAQRWGRARRRVGLLALLGWLVGECPCACENFDGEIGFRAMGWAVVDVEGKGESLVLGEREGGAEGKSSERKVWLGRGRGLGMITRADR